MKLISIFATIVALLGSASAFAQSYQVQQCPKGSVTTYATVSPSATVPMVMSTASTGDAVQSNVGCSLLGGAQASWYVKVTTNGGTSWSWVPVNTLFPATASIEITPPTKDSSGNALTSVVSGSLTYNIYKGASTTALTLLTNVSTLTYTDNAISQTPTTNYYAVTSTCPACLESAQSTVIAATIALPPTATAAPVITVNGASK